MQAGAEDIDRSITIGRLKFCQGGGGKFFKAVSAEGSRQQILQRWIQLPQGGFRLAQAIPLCTPPDNLHGGFSSFEMIEDRLRHVFGGAFSEQMGGEEDIGQAHHTAYDAAVGAGVKVLLGTLGREDQQAQQIIRQGGRISQPLELGG